MAGRIGFQGFEGYTVGNRYHRLSHSGYFEHPNRRLYNGFMTRWWLPLLLSEEPIFERDRRPDNPPFSDRFIRLLGENGAKVTVTIYAVLLLGLFGTVGYFREKHKAALLFAESKTLAGSARESADRHDYGAAIAYALAALPGGNEPVAEAVGALYNAVLNLRERVVFDSGKDDWVRDAVFTPDERFVVTLGHASLRVWEPSTGRLMQTFECHCFIGEGSFSPDGTRLVVWERSEPFLRVYKISQDGFSLDGVLNQHRVAGVTNEHREEISYAEFDRSGRWIVSSSRDGTARL